MSLGKFILFFVLVNLLTPTAHAMFTPNLVLLPRELAMGGAGVGLADTEDSLFINPAGLAGQHGLLLRPLTVATEGDIDVWNTYENSRDIFKNFDFDSLNKIIGTNLEFRASSVPMISVGHFSLAVIADVQYALYSQNQIAPNFNVGYQYTDGLQAGYGMGWKLGRNSNSEVRVGADVKWLNRRGGYYNLDVADTLSFAGGRSYLGDLAGGWGSGVGFDLGTQFIQKLDKITELSFGSSFLDVGGINFSSPQASRVPENWSIGSGLAFDFGIEKLKFALDYQDILELGEWYEHVHAGAEFGIPLIRVQAGINELYFTYGAILDVWLLRFSMLKYTEEIGYSAHQDPSSRVVFELEFKIAL